MMNTIRNLLGIPIAPPDLVPTTTLHNPTSTNMESVERMVEDSMRVSAVDADGVSVEGIVNAFPSDLVTVDTHVDAPGKGEVAKDPTLSNVIIACSLVPSSKTAQVAYVNYTVEKLRLNAKDGKIMVMGATLCLVGALSTAMYTGKMFYLRNVADNSKNLLFHLIDGMTPNWTRGTIFLVSSCLGYGFWFIAQFKLYKIYPHTYSANLLICITASFQSMVIGLCIDRRMASWALGWNLQLITIFYSGALATGATFCLISWAIAKKGPTYPSMFNPLCLIMVAITELVFFGAGISLGSLIGMSLIILGLYLFLWGKNMEIQSEDHLVIIMDGEAAVKLLS
ncbi:unnamed protein product [Cuscuta campestris]|uniref:WAT1-related protein n=1 Tax=Cuscuta campestris TaxID=132261 RepID=A0A484N1I5_9ASTE|nr:unnamed protein product [Cuscuta campestris]